MSIVSKNYRMTNFELCSLTNNLISFMTRDNVEFTARGVTVAMRNAFKAVGDAFAILPSDEEYMGIITDLVAEKAALRDSMTLKVQKISGYVEQKWGIESGKYKRLGIAGLQKMKEIEFIFRAREVVRLAKEYLPDLTPIGLTQLQIDDLDDEAVLFDQKMTETNSAKATREDKTEERTLKGNELYALVVEYARIGKLIWENVNQAKYGDYVIYETSHSGLAKPQNPQLVWNPVGSDAQISWDLVAGALRYDVYTSAVDLGFPSAEYILVNTFTSSPTHVPTVADKRNYFKIKAKNDTQSSDFSDEIWVDCVLPV